MPHIYHKDGRKTWYSEDQVETFTITPNEVERFTNHKDGVNIHFKDGSIRHIRHARTDGQAITFENC